LSTTVETATEIQPLDVDQKRGSRTRPTSSRKGSHSPCWPS